MKTLLAIAATALVGLVTPQTAEAGHSSCNTGYTYQSGRSSCGCPIYTKRVLYSYDCYRRPLYRYYSVPVVHRCSHSRSHSYTHYTPSRHYSHSYSRSHRSHSSRSSYYRGSSRGYSRSSRSRGCR